MIPEEFYVCVEMIFAKTTFYPFIILFFRLWEISVYWCDLGAQRKLWKFQKNFGGGEGWSVDGRKIWICEITITDKGQKIPLYDISATLFKSFIACCVFQSFSDVCQSYAVVFLFFINVFEPWICMAGVVWVRRGKTHESCGRCQGSFMKEPVMHYHKLYPFTYNVHAHALNAKRLKNSARQFHAYYKAYTLKTNLEFFTVHFLYFLNSYDILSHEKLKILR